jgi:methylenetetrahydrofolate dehydrogenase (NADP+)/methenyltetrahydrofolate cyclohydrolase
MTAKIIDGKAIAQQQRLEIANTVNTIKLNGQRPPGLAVILVGSDPASTVYVRNKRLACEEVGFYSKHYDYPADIDPKILFDTINELNHADHIDGILVQLPLPSHIDAEKVLESIAPHKDVDGFDAYNFGRLAQNLSGLHPCTSAGVMTLLARTGINLEGKHACVVGASRIVGRPMALELLNSDATVTICHRYTRDLPAHIAQADVLVVAIGQPRFIQGEWIKEGAVVIDVGITRLPDGTLSGDVDFATAKERASWITPVPGGVGPMTISTLLLNTMNAYRLHSG